MKMILPFFLFLLSFSGFSQVEMKFKKFTSKDVYFSHKIDSTVLIGDTIFLMKGKPEKGTTRMNIVLFRKNGQFEKMNYSQICKKTGIKKYTMYAMAVLRPAGTWLVRENQLRIETPSWTIGLECAFSEANSLVFIRVE